MPTRELVPGDIVELSADNLVPADGIVLEARDLLVSEASLTGESFPVEMQPGVLPAIVSVTPSAGALRMAQRGVIVRHLEAIENLGSMLLVVLGYEAAAEFARRRCHALPRRSRHAQARTHRRRAKRWA